MFCVVAMVLLTASCAGQVSEPCVLHISVVTTPTIIIGTTKTVAAEKSVINGKCTFPTNAHLTWSTSNANVLSLLGSTDSTASIRALKAGSATVSAWLTLTPSVRDSLVMTAVTPTDQ